MGNQAGWWLHWNPTRQRWCWHFTEGHEIHPGQDIALCHRTIKQKEEPVFRWHFPVKGAIYCYFCIIRLQKGWKMPEYQYMAYEIGEEV